MFDFFSPISALSNISKQKAEKNINESFDYLVNNFKNLARIMGDYYPLELLKLSLWEERRVTSLRSKDNFKRVSSSLLPILLQSVLVSTFFTSSGSSRELKSKDWDRLKAISDDSLRRITRIIDNKTALFITQNNASESDAEKYREVISTYLIPQEMDSEKLHSLSIFLRSLLEEKVEIEEVFKTDYVTLALNLDSIAKFGLNGINDLCQRVQLYSDEFSLEEAKLRSSGALNGLSEEEVYKKITAMNHWEGRVESLKNERDGYSLFNVSSASSLPKENFKTITAMPSSLDLISLLKMGYWPVLRFPLLSWQGELYTFVGRYIPLFLILSASFDRRRAALHDVLSLFYHTGVDTYTYDGNSIDISVLPSFFDSNLFVDSSLFFEIKRKRDEEKILKAQYGHKRLIVDPDLEENKKEEKDGLVISSSFMAEASIDKTKKHELITALLGKLELPKESSEYSIVDEDEMDNSELDSPNTDDSNSIDDNDYDNEDEDEKAKELDERDNNVSLVEYEKKNSCDIDSLKERYSLPEEIVKKQQEKEKEDEKYEANLDDDIFDDSEEEESLDDIGETKEDSDSEYYDEIEEQEEMEDEKKEDEENSLYDESQLNFFNILDDESDESSKEEKEIDNELEKEEEDEFVKEEEKEEELDSSSDLASPDEDIDVLLDEDDKSSCKEEENEEESFSPDGENNEGDDGENDLLLSNAEEEAEEEDELEDEEDNSDFTLPSLDENNSSLATKNEEIKDENELDTAETEMEVASSTADEKSEDDTEESFVDKDDNSDFTLPSFDENTNDTLDALESEDNTPSQDDTEGEPSSSDKENPEYPNEEESSESSEIEEKEESSDDLSLPSVEDESYSPLTNEDEDNNSHDEKEKEEDNKPELSSVSQVEEESELGSETENNKEGILGQNDFTLPSLDESEDENKNSADYSLSDDDSKDFVLSSSEEKKPLSFIDSLFMGVADDEEDTPVTEEKQEEKREEKEEKEEVVTHPTSSIEETHIEEVESKAEEDKEHKVVTMDESETENSIELPHMEEEVDDDEEIKLKANGIVYEMYKALGPSSIFASFLRDTSSETLEELEEVIKNCWSRMNNENKDKLFNIYDYSLSIILSKDNNKDELRMAELLNNAGGVMYSRKMDSWTAIIIHINASYILESAIEKTITKESFTPSDWKRVTYIGEQMRKK